MIYTNTKVLVVANNDVDLITRVAESMSDFAKRNNHEFTEFVVEEDEGGFLAIKLPNPYSYELLKSMIPSGELLEFKAIGDTVFEIPYLQKKAYKHYFSDAEKSNIADNLSKVQAEKESLVDEKKLVVKGYSDKIEEKESAISDLASSYRQGWEDRTSDCIVQIDYGSKQKVFIDPETKEVLSMEELSLSDYQLRLDTIRIDGIVKTEHQEPVDDFESEQSDEDEENDLPI
jgi:hypothetical protein